MSLLIPEIGLVFWMTLSFGIVFFILAKFGFPIITKAVEKRNRYIHDSLEAARQAEEKLATINAQADAIIGEARGKRNALLEDAQELKNIILQDAKRVAEAEARQRLDKVKEEIDAEKKKVVGELREQVVGISMRIAEKTIGERLSNDALQKQLIERLLEEEVHK